MSVPDAIAKAEYIDLVTYRKDGSAVHTPVWFAIDDKQRLVVYSDGNAGKMKRARRNSKVEVAPCTMRGNRTGASFQGTVVELPASQGGAVHAMLNRKYGWKKRTFEVVATVGNKLRRKPDTPEGFLAITLVP